MMWLMHRNRAWVRFAGDRCVRCVLGSHCPAAQRAEFYYSDPKQTDLFDPMSLRVLADAKGAVSSHGRVLASAAAEESKEAKQTGRRVPLFLHCADCHGVFLAAVYRFEHMALDDVHVCAVCTQVTSGAIR